MVEPVPLPAVVQWDDQQRLALQRLEQQGRPSALQDVVAQLTGETLQARRVHEEGGDVGIQLGEQFLAEVVDEVAVVAGEVADGARHQGPTVAVGERGEVHGNRPTLGPLQQCGVVGRRDVDTEHAEEGFRLASVERQVGRPHLDEAPADAQAPERQTDRRAPGEHDA